MIEFEKVQTIRKRARTSLRECPECGGVGDVVSMADAAQLFETSRDELIRFVETHKCHRVEDEGRLNLCVQSLLENMQQLIQVRRLTAGKESK